LPNRKNVIAFVKTKSLKKGDTVAAEADGIRV
jgi:hypothetical protein